MSVNTPQEFKIEWATNPDGSYRLYKFADPRGFYCFPPRCAAKRDKIVVLKARVNDVIGVDLPIARAAMGVINDLPAYLNSLAEGAARDLLEGRKCR